MSVTAKRWTKDEESQARFIKESCNSERSIPEIIAGLRRVDRNAKAKMARRTPRMTVL
jgi:hypothetical protein